MTCESSLTSSSTSRVALLNMHSKYSVLVLLVVQEKHSAPALSGLWKIPTGFILESEEIFTGVVREVKEETGIDTEFVEVMAFR
uniref:Nudix hydrolase 8-like n=1 Tax=Nicotiana tabacum TaxID=4097 RepID=A0A1S3XEB1_TOBAC|nr:PREDICTED: nudix hydrolase 8-like [Nicotiana tabacum]